MAWVVPPPGSVKLETETKSCFWPELLAQDRPGFAIYLVGYPADKMGWNKGWAIELGAVALLDKLMKNPNLRNSADVPTVFICDSFGEIVVKQLILKANSGQELNSQKRDFLDHVAGVVFLATPHDGSILATLASEFGWLVTDTMRDLINNSPKLGELSDNYRDYIAANTGRIRHLIYYENERVGIGKVVNSGSANPGIAGADRVPFGRNHINICKMADRSDQVYEGVLAFLDEALKPKGPTQGEKLDEIWRRISDANIPVYTSQKEKLHRIEWRDIECVQYPVMRDSESARTVFCADIRFALRGAFGETYKKLNIIFSARNT